MFDFSFLVSCLGRILRILYILYFVRPWFACQTPKIPKISIFLQGIVEHLDWHGTTRSGIGAFKVPFYVKMTKMPLVNLWLIEGQNWSKPPQNNIFHVFTSNPRLLEIFINYDQVWPGVDNWKQPKNLILIWPSDWVGTNVTMYIIEFYFQRLFMGRNWS